VEKEGDFKHIFSYDNFMSLVYEVRTLKKVVGKMEERNFTLSRTIMGLEERLNRLDQ